MGGLDQMVDAVRLSPRRPSPSRSRSTAAGVLATFAVSPWSATSRATAWAPSPPPPASRLPPPGQTVVQGDLDVGEMLEAA